MLKELPIKTNRRLELLDITSLVAGVVGESGVKEGLAIVTVPHTTAAVTINENADPDVTRDILFKLAETFPQDDAYRHAEGNSDAHIKSSLVGSSLTVIITGGRLLLGTWQGIYFCEFDGPRSRRLHIKVISG